MNVFSLLKTTRTAAQFNEAIPQITADLAKAEATLTALKAQREGVIFDGGPGALTKLLAEIKDAEAQIETLQIALDGAKRRAGEAEAAEKATRLEARHREAQRLPVEERKLLKQWHTAAKRLAYLTSEVDSVQKAIAAENSYMVSEGRRDLKLTTVADSINAERLRKWERHYEGDPNRPVNPPMLHSFRVAQDLRIAGYYPPPPADNGDPLPVPPLAALD